MNRVAYFDLDETITAKDCTSLWIAWLVKQNIAAKELIDEDAKLLEQYYQGNVRIEEYVSVGLRPFIGKPYEHLLSNVNQFIKDEIASVIYPRALERLRWHKARGDTLVLISASAEHLVCPIGLFLGMDHAFGIPISLDDYGNLTSEITGIMTFREGKVMRLKAWLAEEVTAGRIYQESYAYSDSINDKFMLEFVDHAFAINPKMELATLAKQNSWVMYNWQLSK